MTSFTNGFMSAAGAAAFVVVLALVIWAGVWALITYKG